MKKYLIVYRFENEESDDYEDIPAAIERIDQEAIEVFLNTWVIRTELKANDILAELKQYFEKGDKLVISEMARNLETLGLDENTAPAIMGV